MIYIRTIMIFSYPSTFECRHFSIQTCSSYKLMSTIMHMFQARLIVQVRLYNLKMFVYVKRQRKQRMQTERNKPMSMYCMFQVSRFSYICHYIRTPLSQINSNIECEKCNQHNMHIDSFILRSSDGTLCRVLCIMHRQRTAYCIYANSQ